jgi:hypothetical protein
VDWWNDLVKATRYEVTAPDGIVTIRHTLDNSDAAFAEFNANKTVTCVLCNTKIDGTKNKANITRHFSENAGHKTRFEALQKPKQSQITPLSWAKVRVMDEGAQKEKRAVLSLGALKAGVSKSNIHKLYTGDMGTLALSLMAKGAAPQSATTVSRDLNEGLALINAEIKKELAGKFVAVCIDEASSRLGGGGAAARRHAGQRGVPPARFRGADLEPRGGGGRRRAGPGPAPNGAHHAAAQHAGRRRRRWWRGRGRGSGGGGCARGRGCGRGARPSAAKGAEAAIRGGCKLPPRAL